ncbi:MAG TPA: ATP-binding cassette domain-containing protein [Vicinamibacteria bacterium]|nr:ATP-binding cassette domain-containing protein [Vicinamibacteria bacterium]
MTQSAPPTTAASLADVRKSYRSGSFALDGLSLECPEGRILVLLGTSGSGKTTALKLLNRLVTPDAGRVVVLGREATAWDPVELRRRVGWVVQEGALFPHLSVLDNVSLVPRLRGLPEPGCAERGRELLALVGLPPERFAGLRPLELSGGERQRVGVARALAGEPALLLMDEPFGALDPITRFGLRREFAAWQRRLQTSVVLVTHDVAEALQLGDLVAVMDRGRIVQSGPPAEIRERPEPAFVRPFLEAAGLL